MPYSSNRTTDSWPQVAERRVYPSPARLCFERIAETIFKLQAGDVIRIQVGALSIEM